jgi:hypothetical protein
MAKMQNRMAELQGELEAVKGSAAVVAINVKMLTEMTRRPMIPTSN